MTCRALEIVEERIEELTSQLADADSNKLLFIAHSVGELQVVRERIKEEVCDAKRIYEILP